MALKGEVPGGVAFAARPRAAAFGRAPLAVAPMPPSFQIMPDLARDHGSAAWWRGVGSCVTLCAATLAMAPGIMPLPPRVLDTDVGIARAARALAIGPLRDGSTTGRRMAPTAAVRFLTTGPDRPQVAMTVALGQGQGLAAALTRAGVETGEAGQIAAMTATYADPDQLPPGTTLTLTLGARLGTARPVQALSFSPGFAQTISFTRTGGTLVANHATLPLDTAPLTISGSTRGGIYLAATAAGAPYDAIATYLRAISDKVSLGALDAQARYTMVIARDRTPDGQTRLGKLLYIGLVDGDRRLRMIEWNVSGVTDWYDATFVGEQTGGPGFVAPVPGARRTSGFGFRLHPLLGYFRMHSGTDFGAAYGTPIHAVTDGVVAFVGRHGGHGNMVKLAHAGGLGSGYAHMSAFAVSPGMTVRQGQVIGYVGSTGLSTGPHLHFEVYRGGKPVDPASVQFASRALLDGPALAAFQAKLTGYEALAR